MAFGGM
jgi:hypothetical protein